MQQKKQQTCEALIEGQSLALAVVESDSNLRAFGDRVTQRRWQLRALQHELACVVGCELSTSGTFP
jgi:hypothetical protein